MSNIIKPEDFVEPNCVLCMNPDSDKIQAIPQKRIIDKMDEYMSKQDYTGAERHLKYWLEEAKVGNDKRGELFICGELVGHYRKTGNKEEFLKSATRALELIDILDFKDTISAATTYINIATAYNSFSCDETALTYFEKAKSIYESTQNLDPFLSGGLYNNMGLTYHALKRYDDALFSYSKALKIMQETKGADLETAMTYLNMANTYEEKLGLEKAERIIEDLMDKSYECFNSPNIERNGYYAYVCDKCYPTFEYYGYFMYASELKSRMEQIYDRT